MQRFKVFLLFVFLSFYSFGDELRFNKITSIEGISQSEIYSFLKDKHGFIWFGTVDGLNRFDGYRITKYNIDKRRKHSLSNNTIHALTEDSSGRIWIGTDDGLNVFYPNDQEFYHVKLPELKFLFTSIYGLLVDGDILWISTTHGLLSASIADQKLEAIEKSVHQISSLSGIMMPTQNTVELLKHTSGDLWIASYNGINCFRSKNKDSNYEVVKINPVLNTHGVTRMAEDHQGNIWLFYSDLTKGLARYNPKTMELYNFKDSPFSNNNSLPIVSSLTVDKDGNIWIGTINMGLFKINCTDISKYSIQFERFQNNIYEASSLNTNLVFSLYPTMDNILWIGTIGSGINFLDLNQKKFFHHSIPPLFNQQTNSSNFIRAVYLDPKNRLWIGTHNNGLFILDRKTGIYKKLGFDTRAIFYIAPMEGNTNIVCCANGAYMVNPEGNIIKIEGINSACFYATASRKNTFWISGYDGIYRVEISNSKVIEVRTYNSRSTEPKISFDNCRVSIYNDLKNELWIGTEGGGLNIFKLDKNHYPVKNIVYRKSDRPNSISNNYIRSIHKQNQNTYWVGTYEGLNKVILNTQSDSLKFSSYFQSDGLPNNMIQSITEDEKHNLWIGSNGGLTRFNTDSLKITNFDISDGLQSNEFSEHTCFKSETGELYFGGINGITSFFPKEIKESSIQPQITITDFYIYNERIDTQTKVHGRTILDNPIFLTKKLRLKPIENNIRFDFSSMIFTSPHKIKYAYQLVGYDEKWNISDANNRSATYTNLPFGDYIFRVKATNGDGIWNEKFKEIQIKIETPFYLTWIAFVTYFLLFGLIIFYFSLYSIIRITKKKQIVLDAEHNQRLHELDLLRTRFFINISHDLRTPLTLITGPIEQILKGIDYSSEAKKQLVMVYRNAQKLKYLIEQLLDFRKTEVGKLKPKYSLVELNQFIRNEVVHFDSILHEKNIELKYNFHLSEIWINIDTNMVSKIIFNLLSNASKFTKQGYIEISVDINTSDYPQEQYAKIEVTDTGIGIEKERIDLVFDRFNNDSNELGGSGYGIGLSHCKDLLDAMNGLIKVESVFGQGSEFTFYLPYNEKTKENLNTENQPSVVNKPMDEKIICEESVSSKPISSKSKTVLIAEDNKDMREYIKSCLIGAYNIIEAKNGAEGLALAIQKNPDLIISDIVMPIMDGISFCEEVKTTLEISHIPVILLTARPDNEIKFKGLDKGADDYILKPFEIDYLLIKIKNLISSRENLRNLFQNNISLEPSRVTVTSTDEKFLKSLIKEIEQGIPDVDFTIDILERNIGMSHSKFYRKVKSLTGLSGKELLQNMRLKRAAQILSENKISVADVSDMTGFSNPKYFSECFKEKYGVSPSEYYHSG